MFVPWRDDVWFAVCEDIILGQMCFFAILSNEAVRPGHRERAYVCLSLCCCSWHVLLPPCSAHLLGRSLIVYYECQSTAALRRLCLFEISLIKALSKSCSGSNKCLSVMLLTYYHTHISVYWVITNVLVCGLTVGNVEYYLWSEIAQNHHRIQYTEC